jgi:hypothetical protein
MQKLLRGIMAAGVACLALGGIGLAQSANAQDNVFVRAAGAYASFQDDISSLRGAPIASSRDLDAALDLVATHDPTQVARGWMAYAAIVGSQASGFTQSVRETAAFYGRDRFLLGLRNDLGYARTIAGADQVVQLALAAAASDASRIEGVAARYKQSAYDLQRSSWAAMRADPAATRNASLRSRVGTAAVSSTALQRLTVQAGGASGGMVMADSPGGTLFWDSIRGSVATPTGLGSPTQRGVKADQATTIDRIVTLSAYYAVNAGPEMQARLDALMSEQLTKNCVEWSRLQMYQCISAARFKYEHAFCLAEHGMTDVGKCVRKAVE